MVVNNSYFVGIARFPSKADAPLLIDSDAMLSGSISRKSFETIGWGDTEVVEISRLTEHRELVKCALLNVAGKFSRPPLIPNFFRFRIGKALDHWSMFRSFTPRVNDVLTPRVIV